MSQERHKPYIVSSDTQPLMQKWAATHGLKAPGTDYFLGMRRDLQNVLQGYFPGEVVVVPHQDLKTGVDALAKCSPWPLLSLDRVYLDPTLPNFEGYIDATRVVDENFKDLGFLQRPGFVPLQDQITAHASKEVTPVTLVDDVIFSGGGMKTLVNELMKVNRPVNRVIAGIGISEGVTKLREMGLDVRCVMEFDAVEDETCERDFVACAPMSGRTVHGSDGQIWSAPYFSPVGHPEKWASIPSERVADFSAFCMNQSVNFWREVERVSSAEVHTGMVNRRLRGMPDRMRVVDSLLQYNYSEGAA